MLYAQAFFNAARGGGMLFLLSLLTTTGIPVYQVPGIKWCIPGMIRVFFFFLSAVPGREDACW